MHSIAPIHPPTINITIHTDASLTRWSITDGHHPSGRKWDLKEISHMNILKLKAILIGVRTYGKDGTYKQVRVMSDNTTATAYVNNKGGIKSPECNEIAYEIWHWCIQQILFIFLYLLLTYLARIMWKLTNNTGKCLTLPSEN